MRDMSSNSTKRNLDTIIEAILFVSPSPISTKQFADLLNEKPKAIEEALKSLTEYYLTRGIRLQVDKGRYQITTAPEYADIVESFLGLEENTTLSQAALEALAIVAYKQPITRPVIDEIRGVNSDGVMRNLLNKGLIQEMGRAEGVGRAILYGTTPDFLQFFGISSINELPKFDLLPGNENGESKILKD